MRSGYCNGKSNIQRWPTGSRDAEAKAERSELLAVDFGYLILELSTHRSVALALSQPTANHDVFLNAELGQPTLDAEDTSTVTETIDRARKTSTIFTHAR